MKGIKRKCMASNIVRRSGQRKKLKTQEDGSHVFDDHMADTNPDQKKYALRATPTRSKHISKEPLQKPSATASKNKSDAPVDKNKVQSDNILRRSSRYRVPPLDFWRNERLVFKSLASGEVQCMGVDKGTEADNYGLNQILKKIENRKKKSQKKTAKNVKNTPILDNQNGEIVHKRVHQPFESLQWAVPRNEEVQMPTYHIAKTFTSRSNTFGFLDISPFVAKESQCSPIYNLHFVVVKGPLEVTIQDTHFAFTVGDTWIVPVGVPYSIKNYTRAKALVSFSTFKE
ncbi:CENP-C_C domain-containing protein [Trichonephila clavata]|uniref:CENP-C_C domain-containing protein n=1 Tax=Trichonephila clavata TaxID=2740835 RepID=A0A8X6L7A1_TRICU|nr:CENP-C_C domain-containing protein [Trichonephila clavata]